VARHDIPDLHSEDIIIRANEEFINQLDSFLQRHGFIFQISFACIVAVNQILRAYNLPLATQLDGII